MSMRTAFLVLIGLLQASAAFALEGSGATAPSRREFAGGPYCGVYCVYAVLRMNAVEVDMDDLLQRRYVGSFLGSSMEELQRAIRDHGGEAIPMGGLTTSALRWAEDPIILHVRRPGYGMPYGHWVLFLGMEGGRARIVDPPNDVQLVPLAELSSVWDGTGLVVSMDRPSRWPIHLGAWLEHGVVLALLLVVLALVRAMLHYGRGRLGVLTMAAVLLAVSVVAGVVWHSLHDEGLWRNRAAVAQVVGAHFQPHLRRITTDQVARLIGKPDVTIIDARYPRAYDMGHIRGAINLPIYSGIVERSEILAGIDPDQHVIVYCQSEGCIWAEVIAADLIFRGFERVEVYSGGWREWSDYAAGITKP